MYKFWPLIAGHLASGLHSADSNKNYTEFHTCLPSATVPRARTNVLRLGYRAVERWPGDWAASIGSTQWWFYRRPSSRFIGRFSRSVTKHRAIFRARAMASYISSTELLSIPIWLQIPACRPTAQSTIASSITVIIPVIKLCLKGTHKSFGTIWE